MSTPRHHPDELDLLDFARGALAEPFAVAIAAHLVYCAACRIEVAWLESVGGALLEAADAVPVAPERLSAVLAACAVPVPDAPADRAEPGAIMPLPLQRFVDRFGTPAWRRRLPGIEMAELNLPNPGYAAMLVRAAPGRALPRHGHRGREMAVILAGGLTDETGNFGPGDFATADPSLVHRPVADRPEGCLCFIVRDAPLRFCGPFGILLNLMTR